MGIAVNDTATLLGVLTQLDPFEPFLLNMFFPNQVNFDTQEIDFDVIAEDMTLAPFVSPMVAGKADKHAGGTLKKFKPAYLKPKNVVDPNHVITRKAGEAIGGSLTAAQRRNAIIVDLLQIQRKRIRMRQEWMAAQALLTGKVTVEGEDYPTVEVDFLRDALNTVQLAGLDVWSDTTNATPLDDIEDWGVQSEAPITTLVFAPSAWKLFIKHQAVKDLLDTRRGSESRVEMAPGNGKHVVFKGMLGEIQCWVYSGYYRDAAGAKQMFIPANTVIAGSEAVEGVRGFGAILDPRAGYQSMEVFPKNWISEDPAAEFVMSQSGPLMIPKRVNASMAITVI